MKRARPNSPSAAEAGASEALPEGTIEHQHVARAEYGSAAAAASGAPHTSGGADGAAVELPVVVRQQLASRVTSVGVARALDELLDAQCALHATDADALSLSTNTAFMRWIPMYGYGELAEAAVAHLPAYVAGVAAAAVAAPAAASSAAASASPSSAENADISTLRHLLPHGSSAPLVMRMLAALVCAPAHILHGSALTLLRFMHKHGYGAVQEQAWRTDWGPAAGGAAAAEAAGASAGPALTLAEAQSLMAGLAAGAGAGADDGSGGGEHGQHDQQLQHQQHLALLQQHHGLSAGGDDGEDGDGGYGGVPLSHLLQHQQPGLIGSMLAAATAGGGVGHVRSSYGGGAPAGPALPSPELDAGAPLELGMHASGAPSALAVRRGQWLQAEDAFAAVAIEAFREGLLPLAEGTSLREYLSAHLQCSVMRITKRFQGDGVIGRNTYRRRVVSGPEEWAAVSGPAIARFVSARRAFRAAVERGGEGAMPSGSARVAGSQGRARVGGRGGGRGGLAGVGPRFAVGSYSPGPLAVHGATGVASGSPGPGGAWTGVSPGATVWPGLSPGAQLGGGEEPFGHAAAAAAAAHGDDDEAGGAADYDEAAAGGEHQSAAAAAASAGAGGEADGGADEDDEGGASSSSSAAAAHHHHLLLSGIGGGSSQPYVAPVAGPRGRLAWGSGDDEALIAAVQAGDAAGLSRTATCAAVQGALMSGRTAGAIAQRVNRLVNLGKLPLAGGSSGGNPASWSAAEDEALVAALAAGDAAGLCRSTTMAAAAAAIPGRTLGAVQNRVNHLVACGRVDRVHAAHSAWSAAEDESLAAALLAGDAAGMSRNAGCAAYASACVPPRSTSAVWQHMYKLVTAGRVPPVPQTAANGAVDVPAGAAAAGDGTGTGFGAAAASSPDAAAAASSAEYAPAEEEEGATGSAAAAGSA